jgi:hypothetical protein
MDGEVAVLHGGRDLARGEALQLEQGVGAALRWTRRGNFVLHGSCISIDGIAFSFVGPSGRGKSTLAALLNHRGHRLISDGMTLVEASEAGLRVWPGPARFKLDDTCLTMLGCSASELQPVYEGALKRFLDARDPGDASSTALPKLGGIYVLEEGERLAVEALNGASALDAVFANMYLLPFVDAADAPLFFAQAAQVTRRASVWRFTRPRGFERSSEVVGLIESHVTSRLP